MDKPNNYVYHEDFTESYIIKATMWLLLDSVITQGKYEFTDNVLAYANCKKN